MQEQFMSKSMLIILEVLKASDHIDTQVHLLKVFRLLAENGKNHAILFNVYGYSSTLFMLFLLKRALSWCLIASLDDKPLLKTRSACMGKNISAQK